MECTSRIEGSWCKEFGVSLKSRHSWKVAKKCRHVGKQIKRTRWKKETVKEEKRINEFYNVNILIIFYY